jgi:GDPmannose 4,6-dehydratase
LLGDATKAKTKLGWTPRISFAQLVDEMVQSDLKEAERDALVRERGFSSFRSRE